MLINPNLYSGDYYFAKDCINYRNNADFKRIGDCVYVDSEENKKPLLFTEVQKVGFVKDDKITITAYIENVGEIPIDFELTGFYGVFKVFTLNPGESRTLKDSFVSTDDKNQFRFTASQTGKMGVRCVGIKWELGEATPYISNRNNLEPSKQAIYLAGGGIPRGVSSRSLNLVDFDQLCLGVLYAS